MVASMLSPIVYNVPPVLFWQLVNLKHFASVFSFFSNLFLSAPPFLLHCWSFFIWPLEQNLQDNGREGGEGVYSSLTDISQKERRGCLCVAPVWVSMGQMSSWAARHSAFFNNQAPDHQPNHHVGQFDGQATGKRPSAPDGLFAPPD